MSFSAYWYSRKKSWLRADLSLFQQGYKNWVMAVQVFFGRTNSNSYLQTKHHEISKCWKKVLSGIQNWGLTVHVFVSIELFQIVIWKLCIQNHYTNFAQSVEKRSQLGYKTEPWLYMSLFLLIFFQKVALWLRIQNHYTTLTLHILVRVSTAIQNWA